MVLRVCLLLPPYLESRTQFVIAERISRTHQRPTRRNLLRGRCATGLRRLLRIQQWIADMQYVVFTCNYTSLTNAYSWHLIPRYWWLHSTALLWVSDNVGPRRMLSLMVFCQASRLVCTLLVHTENITAHQRSTLSLSRPL